MGKVEVVGEFFETLSVYVGRVVSIPVSMLCIEVSDQKYRFFCDYTEEHHLSSRKKLSV